MALLKLPRVSRATTSSGKEFQVDATLRENKLCIQSIKKTFMNDFKTMATSNTAPR